MTETPQKKRKRRGSGRVTMKDVAKLSGVAPITVSRVLSGSDYASPAARDAVMAAVRELGYVPNRMAGGLASVHAPVVPILVPALRNAVFSDIIMGAQEHFFEHGLETLIGNTLYSISKEEHLTRTFLGWSPPAIMITGGTHSQATRDLLSSIEIPVIELMELVEKPLGINVGLSHAGAGYDMTSVLIERGYEDIAFLGTMPDRDLRALKRMEGYQKALRDNGLRGDGFVQFYDQPSTFQLAAQFADIYLENRAKIRAVFCANDVLAVGLLMECQRRGIAVPGELAIAGFNDLSIAESVHPRLTTVHVPRYEMGTKAASMLVEVLSGETLESPIYNVGYEIIEREST
ncbi:LacI family DNA-binding transcriptional regulator [Oceanidesulfovibrio marinus]|uniref:LacI family DNA-binding transcriptional regulator n=1 Tax=Oceanidesulfovibrio marinus TaxID=370038 RepID=A0ABX6NDW7_9BACT|nr:LacI family DNA-binding transcriptional regulator [Oceanidesulfovibrio marinus]QJT08788.1 LacI family DNA-binding transcriptional regulator [Oceanidesulfovibrio marinus]